MNMEGQQYCKVRYPSSVDEETAVLMKKEIFSSNYFCSSKTPLFNDKYPMHVLPHPENPIVFTHRISYDTGKDIYYENGITNKVYLEFWDRGILEFNNIVYYPSYDHTRNQSCRIAYLTRDNFGENFRKSSYIVWKFDYSPTNLQILEGTVRLQHSTLNPDTQIVWYICKLTDNDPTDHKNLNWKIIWFNPIINQRNQHNHLYINVLDDVSITYLIKGGTGFMLRVELRGGHTWEDAQLFRQNMDERDPQGLYAQSETSPFGMDIRIKLKQKKIDEHNSKRSIVYHASTKEEITNNPSDPFVTGLFNNTYRLNILPHQEKSNTFLHRMSYNARTDAYYENGIIEKKYLRIWRRGTLKCKNIAYDADGRSNTIYLCKNPFSTVCSPSLIMWKFDYRPGNLLISSLSVKLDTAMERNYYISWSILALPSNKNQNPEWKSIKFETEMVSHDVVNYFSWNGRIDISDLVKYEYGFILKGEIVYCSRELSWIEAVLFKQRMNKPMPLMDDDENFGMDIRVELVPDITCDPLPLIQWKGNFSAILNDKSTCDFIIILKQNEYTGELQDCFPDFKGYFYVHSHILLAYSDYFRAMFNSNMLEANERRLELCGVSYLIMDKILYFMYYGEILPVNGLSQWYELLYGATRFFVQTLIQRCEKEISKYVTKSNINEIHGLAMDCGAQQLVRYCDMFYIGDESYENRI
ncbi:15208_t:CDS:2 [Funneliformis caledonium]|uniref:15208_t:CDS:1 n=1 Tax=Funneliformis caledonium TaxID=1117310 RepID=A0A9N9BF32_9GLOM|nr:15208_t:CDS:2 [Funneliformis caledonium]